MSFLKDLCSKNRERQKIWDKDGVLDEMFKTVELVGEVGELCNNIKKIKRLELGLKGSRCSREDLESEFGDVLITLTLLADYCGVDLEKVTIEKFNNTSKKQGFNVFLSGDNDD